MTPSPARTSVTTPSAFSSGERGGSAIGVCALVVLSRSTPTTAGGGAVAQKDVNRLPPAPVRPRTASGCAPSGTRTLPESGSDHPRFAGARGLAQGRGAAGRVVEREPLVLVGVRARRGPRARPGCRRRTAPPSHAEAVERVQRAEIAGHDLVAARDERVRQVAPPPPGCPSRPVATIARMASSEKRDDDRAPPRTRPPGACARRRGSGTRASSGRGRRSRPRGCPTSGMSG